MREFMSLYVYACRCEYVQSCRCVYMHVVVVTCNHVAVFICMSLLLRVFMSLCLYACRCEYVHSCRCVYMHVVVTSVERWVEYHLDRTPDMSDMPDIPDAKLQFWGKVRKSDKGKPFASMPGLKGAWVLLSFDFAASKNQWGVVLVDDTDSELVLSDLVPSLILHVFLRYVSLMHGKPMPHVNSAQLVLKYMLANRKALTAAYRNRLYRFSSGSAFADCTQDLQDLLERTGTRVLREVCHNLCMPS